MTDEIKDKQENCFNWKPFPFEDTVIQKALGAKSILEFKGTPREALKKIVDGCNMNGFGDQDRNLLRALKIDGFTHIPYQIMNREYISSDLTPKGVIEAVADKIDIAAGIIHQLIHYIEVKEQEKPPKTLDALKEFDLSLYEHVTNSDWKDNPIITELFNNWLRS